MTDAVQPRPKGLFTPKLATMFREGYGLGDFRADAVAGLTVAIVALPLSMAIAVACGVSPDRGLHAAIVGGFLVSALGGSRFQIGGPAGAFIVLVAATVYAHGVDGLALATLMSGGMLVVAGLLRVGALIRRIPHAVTVGFTAGIAVIILASQFKDLLGVTLAEREPGPFLPKLAALAAALPTVNPASVAVAVGVALVILAFRRWRPGWPGLLIAVLAATVAATLLRLPVETLGDRFGAIPGGLPMPHLPDISVAKLAAVLPAALSFTLLGGVESLLSAVVADTLTGRRHRSHIELIAQGAGNIGSAFFGGIPVTGTIARTATNIRAGARGPVSGIMHSLYLLVFTMLAAPLLGYVPLAALAGLLAVVAWNMVERKDVAAILAGAKGPAAVLAVTFVLTVLHDLITGIVAGCLLAGALALWRRRRGVAS